MAPLQNLVFLPGAPIQINTVCTSVQYETFMTIYVGSILHQRKLPK